VLRKSALDLDDNMDHMTLVFDETVDVSTYDAGMFTFHSLASGGTSYQLVGGRVLTTDAPTVTVQLSKADRDAIKLLADMCIDETSCFLEMLSGGFDDMTSSESLNPAAAADMEATFSKDDTDPVLEAYQVDINNKHEAVLTLNFNEPVDTDTFNPQGLTLQENAAISTGVTYTLKEGSTDTENGLQMVVNITVDDLNEVKKLETLYIDAASAFLSVLPAMVS
jgi:hypothetical protein